MMKLLGMILFVGVGWLFWLMFNGGGWNTAFGIAACLLFLVATMLVFNKNIAIQDAGVLVTGAMLAGTAQWLDVATLAIAQLLIFILLYIVWIAFSYFLFGTPMIVIPFPPFFIFTWREMSQDQQSAMWLRFLSLGVLVFILYIVAQI